MRYFDVKDMIESLVTISMSVTDSLKTSSRKKDAYVNLYVSEPKMSARNCH